jgi:tRNA A-37 threonylcarbamoyl transferase component Bud32
MSGRSVGDGVTAVPAGERRAELAPGARLGRYEIVRLLGRGGMGQVYLARHELQRTLHAVKILPAEFAGKPGFVERFRTELRTMAAMQHPNVVHVTHSDEERGRYYLVMEFVAADGGGEPYDLEEALAEKGRFEPETVRRLALQLCEGLAHAHGQGVVHRDLKPANVLLTSKDLGKAAEARICDFGLARVAGEEQVRALVAESMRRSLSLGDRSTFVERRREERSSMGAVLGTYGYMSPEQEEGRPADARSDLYALGVMLYRMLTGQRLRGMAKPASQVVPGLDPAWDEVIGKCLEHDPAARWQTAAELAAALSGTTKHTKNTKRGGPRSARRGLAAAAVAAVVAAAGYGTYRTYGTYSARRAEERARAEQAAAMDAAARAKAEGLRAAAEAALAAGDLEAAGARIAELKGAGGPASVSADLQKKYEAKAGERETNRRYAAASVARERAAKLERGQGFGARLDALEVTWREAEAARQGGGWGQALSGYDAALAACKALGEAEASREDAKARRGAAEAAKAEAEQAGSASDAEELFAEGGRGSTRAAELFETGDFAGASKAWGEASQSYASAKTRALASQAYAKAKAEVESELGGPASTRAALLEAHGGAKWSEVKRLRTLGAASANDPAAGEKAYRDALAALPGAVAEAQAAKQAEADRLAAEAKAREEKARREKVEAALAAARQARAAGEWQVCVERAGEALALEAGNAEAAALKKEAEASLVPTLTVEVEAGGRAVAAEISDGERRYRAPHTFALEAGRRYSFAVAGFSGDAAPELQGGAKTRYKPETVEVTADWRGPKTRRVTLEEVTGPPEGGPWISPATGMEFVWVPALKLWVGKYEVTNGEYRKKEPGHDSKDFEGHTLNGDRQPAVFVNFDDAKAYAAWLTERDRERLGGLRYRVLSEAEWQACAQCGDGREYPWGNAMPPKWGNYSDSASAWRYKIDGYTDGHAVACDVERSGENEWGLYGIGGNVWECCASDVSGGSFGAWRGASWNDLPVFLRVAYRIDNGGSGRDYYGGFRLALSR